MAKSYMPNMEFAVSIDLTSISPHRGKLLISCILMEALKEKGFTDVHFLHENEPTDILSENADSWHNTSIIPESDKTIPIVITAHRSNAENNELRLEIEKLKKEKADMATALTAILERSAAITDELERMFGPIKT